MSPSQDEASLADWKAAYNKLHDQRNKAEQDSHEFQRIVREQNSDLAALRSQVATLGSELKASVENTFAAMLEASALRAQVATLEAELQDSNEDKGALRSALEYERAQLAKSLNKNASTEQGIRDIWKDNCTLRSQVATLEAEVAKFQRSVRELSNIRAQLAAAPDLSALEAALDDPGNWYDEGGVLVIRASVKFALDLTRASQPKGESAEAIRRRLGWSPLTDEQKEPI